MRITVITPYFPPEYNGVSLSVYYRVIALSQLGHVTTLFAPEYPDHLYDHHTMAPDRPNVTVRRLPSRHFPHTATQVFPARGSRLRNAFLASEQVEPELLIVDDPHIWLLATGVDPFSLLSTSSPRIVGIIHADVPSTLRRYHRPLVAMAMQLTIPIMANRYSATVFASRSLRDRYPRVKNAVVVEHLGVDRERFCPRPSTRGQRLVVLYVGRMEPDKGVDWLIESAVSFAFADIQFHFVGHGSVLKKHPPKDSASIRITGGVSHFDLPPIYQRADIFISACEFEAYGLSIVEALACGLPVLLPKSSALAAEIESRGAGVTYGDRDRGSLWRALTLLKADRSKLATMSAAARSIPRDWRDSTKMLLSSITRRA